MSKLAQQEKQKAADRKQQAMRMNYTKVKPTVVKHVLDNQVMNIQQPPVSYSSTHSLRPQSLTHFLFV